MIVKMSRVVEINSVEAQNSFITNNSRALIFFGSNKCNHCRSMVPIFDKLSKKYTSVAFGHVEVTKVKVENLVGVPVFVAYKDHGPIDSVLGSKEQAIIKMIESRLL